MTKEFYIPVPGFSGDEIAEITVNVNGKKMKYEFRIESFPWTDEENGTGNKNSSGKPEKNIYNLKKAIESYDKEWELIQIFTPGLRDTHVHVLYRKKNKQTE